VTRREALILIGVLVSLILATIVGVTVSEARDWQPWELFGLLLVLAIGSDMLIVEVRSFSSARRPPRSSAPAPSPSKRS
jgi:hypothetical protein